jgi:hypothetical protein
MTDKPEPVVTENMPARESQISAAASANAPFIYFDGASYFGLYNGIGQLTLEALDRVLVAHLRSSLAALRSLRSAIDSIVQLAEAPRPDPPSIQ